MLIDAHAHLAHEKLRHQTEGVLARARQAGVVAVVCSAGDLAEARSALELSQRRPEVFCTAGVHPHEAGHAGEDYLAHLESLLEQPRCAALGEIGLDYHYDFSPRDVQRRVFAEQLDLARRKGTTVIVHTREAFDDTLAILAESGTEGTRVIFHSFTGGPEEADRALEFGATLSFSGIVTFSKADALRRAARLTPEDRLLVETDCPYLSPEPVRNQKVNEPAHVVHVARCLAELRGCRLEELAWKTTENAMRILEKIELVS